MLLSIQALLSAPNPDDPLANDVAEKWKSSEAEAIETGESKALNRFNKVFAALSICLSGGNSSLCGSKEYLAYVFTVHSPKCGVKSQNSLTVPFLPS